MEQERVPASLPTRVVCREVYPPYPPTIPGIPSSHRCTPRTHPGRHMLTTMYTRTYPGRHMLTVVHIPYIPREASMRLLSLRLGGTSPFDLNFLMFLTILSRKCGFRRSGTGVGIHLRTAVSCLFCSFLSLFCSLLVQTPL